MGSGSRIGLKKALAWASDPLKKREKTSIGTPAGGKATARASMHAAWPWPALIESLAKARTWRIFGARRQGAREDGVGLFECAISEGRCNAEWLTCVLIRPKQILVLGRTDSGAAAVGQDQID